MLFVCNIPTVHNRLLAKESKGSAGSDYVTTFHFLKTLKSGMCVKIINLAINSSSFTIRKEQMSSSNNCDIFKNIYFSVHYFSFFVIDKEKNI